MGPASTTISIVLRSSLSLFVSRLTRHPHSDRQQKHLTLFYKEMGRPMTVISNEFNGGGCFLDSRTGGRQAVADHGGEQDASESRPA